MQNVTDPVEAERERAACRPIVESRRPPCPVCQAPMEPEHAHHKCPSCGYIEPCCGW
jgi:tRNA(Ile2) C34 agmatinyltransferase TiaS